MAMRDEFKGANLTPTESQLLNLPQIGNRLQRGEKVKVNELPMLIAQNLGLEQGQSINFKPSTLADLGLGTVQRSRFIPKQSDTSETLSPLKNLGEVLNIVKGTKPVQSITYAPDIFAGLPGYRKITPSGTDILKAQIFKDIKKEELKNKLQNQLIQSQINKSKGTTVGNNFLNSLLNFFKPNANTISPQKIIPETGEIIDYETLNVPHNIRQKMDLAVSQGANPKDVLKRTLEYLNGNK